MPELPEVEVSRQGLLPYLVGQRIERAIFRVPRLRRALTEDLAATLAGRRIVAIARRGKYLLFDCESPAAGRGEARDGDEMTDGGSQRGWLIVHLGMSGSLRLVPPGTTWQKHDHVDLVFADTVLRFRDPRRFGLLAWHPGMDIYAHPLLAAQGIEPLSPQFDGGWLYAATRRRTAPIKPLLMDSHLVVGIGNIYAAESLFLAGISPLRRAGRLTRAQCVRLAEAVRMTLLRAIAAGGSSVRDYVHSDGGAGSFQMQCAVYDRAGAPCVVCSTPIRCVRQSGRSSFYCPQCQK